MNLVAWSCLIHKLLSNNRCVSRLSENLLPILYICCFVWRCMSMLSCIRFHFKFQDTESHTNSDLRVHTEVMWKWPEADWKRLDSWLLWVTYEEEKLNKAQILVLFIPQCERSLNLNLLTVSSGWLIYKDCYFITVLIFPLCYKKRHF